MQYLFIVVQGAKLFGEYFYYSYDLIRDLMILRSIMTNLACVIMLIRLKLNLKYSVFCLLYLLV